MIKSGGNLRVIWWTLGANRMLCFICKKLSKATSKAEVVFFCGRCEIHSLLRTGGLQPHY